MPGIDPPAAPNDQTTSLLAKAYQQLAKIIDEIVVLRVTTVVGAVTATNAADPGTATTITVAPEGQLVAHYAVNTALGDANIVISKGFLEDDALARLHAQALTDSRAIRKESIEMLRSAIESILGHAKG